MTESHDDVSKIHKRYSFTLLTPSSYYQSLIISIITVLALSTIVLWLYVEKTDDLIFRLPAVIGVLMVTQYLDSRFIRNKEYSKALHMSFFGNFLWLGIILMGIASWSVLAKDTLSLLYVVEGTMLFASFRIGILTTTLGVSLRKAWLICFIQPLGLLLTLIPIGMWQEAFTPTSLSVGATFLAVASVWSVMTDRAGRPQVESTHKLVQGYLASISTKDFSEVESILESRSHPETVMMTQIKMGSQNNNLRVVLPDIHPGPYHPIGGSNISYRIYKSMNSSAMILHSVSDHALNLPSQKEVENYLRGMASESVVKKGMTCTEPVAVQVNKARVTGILFDKTAILFLSLSPHGMEDVPSYVKKQIEQLGANRHFERVLVVDCHNAMGKEISEPDSQDMLNAAKSTLETLVTKESVPFEFGYANSDHLNLSPDDMGQGGLSVLCLKINGSKYFIGWADANNMENGLREEVVSQFAKNGMNLLEICTSDTHYSATTVRTRDGYYHLGKITETDQVAEWYLKIARNAEKMLAPASFEIIEQKINVRVMGSAIFEDFARAIERCLNLSKVFMGGCVAFFIATLFL